MCVRRLIICMALLIYVVIKNGKTMSTDKFIMIKMKFLMSRLKIAFVINVSMLTLSKCISFIHFEARGMIYYNNLK